MNMGKEIERKFLIADERWRHEVESSVDMIQGYVSRRTEGTVRLRVAGDKAWLTVKSRNNGAERGNGNMKSR